MKTTKIFLVITFVAFATMIFAQVERPNQNDPAPIQIQKSVKITLERALHNPALKKAIYQQVRPTLLTPDKPVYVATVRHNRSVYYVYGSYAAWKTFFERILDVDPISKIGSKALKP